MGKTTSQYVREYKWSNILAMIRNGRRDPQICTDDFQGRLVVITGATSGIGLVTARKYASHGANLLVINRSRAKSEQLCSEIEQEFGVACSYKTADLSKLAEVVKVSRELAELPGSIDVLIHNAGVYLSKRELTEDNLEKVFVVNYLSSFIMNYMLIDKLKSQERARILMVGSEGHRFAAWGIKPDDLNFERRSYSGMKSYGSAKMAQLLSMIPFRKLLLNSGVTINTMHPGAVLSNTGSDNGPVYQWFKRNFINKTLKSPEISAAALYYLGVSKEVEGVNGRFFNLTTEEEPAPPALDEELADELWEVSLKILNSTLK